MGHYLDFENEKYEKGYKPFSTLFLDSKSIKKYIGKKICFVTSVDRYRGYYTVKYGVIHSKRYSTLYLNDGDDSVDVRNIKECGIEID